MARRLPSAVLAALLAATWLLATAVPAMAACHVAVFVDSEAEGEESVGVISLVVELQGRVGSCAGTVDVATVDGTATAGEDYEALEQTLTFEENDDRVETVGITLLADDETEEAETFMVELSNPTGSISGTGDPATVTIAAQDGAAPAGDEPTDDATTDDTPTDGVTIEDGAAADGGTDEAAEDDDGNNHGIILAVVAALVIGGGAFALLRGRGA